MLRVGIYVPITLNEQFINSIYFLTRSLDRFSGLTNYKIVFTVSRDGMTDLESPSLNWAKGYPIEFHLCDEIVWTVHANREITENKPWFQYAATMKQQLANDFDEDVVVFMDADTVVCGSLIEVVARAAQEGKILARTAWQPPSVDLTRALGERGCVRRTRIRSRICWLRLVVFGATSLPALFQFRLHRHAGQYCRAHSGQRQRRCRLC